jgi:hypothetical protein
MDNCVSALQTHIVAHGVETVFLVEKEGNRFLLLLKVDDFNVGNIEGLMVSGDFDIKNLHMFLGPISSSPSPDRLTTPHLSTAQTPALKSGGQEVEREIGSLKESPPKKLLGSKKHLMPDVEWWDGVTIL